MTDDHDHDGLTPREKRRLWFVVGLLAALVVVPVVGMALDDAAAIESGATFNASQGPALTVAEDTDADVTLPFPAEDEVFLGDVLVRGPPIGADVTGLQPGEDATLDFDGPTALDDGLALERVDAPLNVTATSGEFVSLGLASGADVDMAGAITAETGGDAPIVEVAGFAAADEGVAVGIFDSGGNQLDGDVISDGTATFALPESEDLSLEIAATDAIIVDTGSMDPNDEVFAPGETTTASIDVDHVDGESMTVDFYEFVTGDPETDPQIGTDSVAAGETASTSWTVPDADGIHQWYAVVEDESGNVATSGTAFIVVDADELGSPSIVSGSEFPEDGAVVEADDQLLEIDVDHDNSGESLTVTFYEYVSGDPDVDPVIDSDTVSAPDTASVWATIDDGLDWYVVAEDSNDRVAISGVFSIGTYGELEIRDADDGSLVDDRTVRIEATGPGITTTVDVTDGTLDFAELGIDADAAVTMDVTALDYYETAVEFPSLTMADTIYLQRGPDWEADPDPADDDPTDTPDPADDDDVVLVRFELDDRTAGHFPPDNSSLDVRDENGTLHAERFGSTNRVDVILQRSQRYQLVVEGPRETRDIGGFTASESETVPIRIEGLFFDIRDAEPIGIDVGIERINDDPFVAFHYTDPQNATTMLDIFIHKRGNESVVLYEETVIATADPLGNYTVTRPLVGNDSERQWTVKWEFTRNGTTYSGARDVLADPSHLDLPIGDGATAILGIGLVIVVGGLFSARNAAVGGIIVPCVGGLLWMVGILSGVVAGVAVVSALVVGVAYTFAVRGSP